MTADEQWIAAQVAELIRTRPEYAALLAGGVPMTLDCIHLGADRVRVAGSNRDWRACGHPDQPLGATVCKCLKPVGCGAKCKGYTLTGEES